MEDSEDLKVGLSDLKEQLETPKETGISFMQIGKQARSERGQKLFQIFRQEENEVYIASLGEVGCTTEWIGGAGKALSGTDAGGGAAKRRQEVLAGLVEDKSRLQSRETEKYYETIFEEMRELEEKKSKEALVLVRKKHILSRCQSEKESDKTLD